MKPKHTTGPWSVTFALIGPPREQIAVIRALDSICGMRNMGDYTEEEFQANAHLIAAAPDLFEACEEAHRFLTELAPKNRQSAKDKLLAALIRARGGEDHDKPQEGAQRGPVEGKVYRVTYKLQGQKLPRSLVATYMGKGGVLGHPTYNFSGRPVFGTCPIWLRDIISIEETSDPLSEPKIERGVTSEKAK